MVMLRVNNPNIMNQDIQTQVKVYHDKLKKWCSKIPSRQWCEGTRIAMTSLLSQSRAAWGCKETRHLQRVSQTLLNTNHSYGKKSKDLKDQCNIKKTVFKWQWHRCSREIYPIKTYSHLYSMRRMMSSMSLENNLSNQYDLSTHHKILRYRQVEED